MAKKRDTRELVLKLRFYPAPAVFISVWLIERDGCADSGVLFGEVLPATAEWLAERLGIKVEREASPADPGEPMKGTQAGRGGSK